MKIIPLQKRLLWKCVLLKTEESYVSNVFPAPHPIQRTVSDWNVLLLCDKGIHFHHWCRWCVLTWSLRFHSFDIFQLECMNGPQPQIHGAACQRLVREMSSANISPVLYRGPIRSGYTRRGNVWHAGKQMCAHACVVTVSAAVDVVPLLRRYKCLYLFTRSHVGGLPPF